MTQRADVTKVTKISLAASNVTERDVTWAATGETRDNEGEWEIDSRKNTKKFN